MLFRVHEIISHFARIKEWKEGLQSDPGTEALDQLQLQAALVRCESAQLCSAHLGDIPGIWICPNSST